MNILIIMPEWVEKIFKFNKDWEIRGSDTKKRGWIKIAASKTGCVYGEVFLAQSIPLTRNLWNGNMEKHQVGITWDELVKRYKKPYAWVFTEKKIYEQPQKYNHPKGAVIWVKE